MRSDLLRRFEEAEEEGRLVTAQSDSDARRLRAGRERGDLVSPAVKVFARADTWSRLKPPERALRTIRTLADLHPSWVFCDISAALVYGLSVSYALVDAVHVTTRCSTRARDSRGITRQVVSDPSFETIGGIKVTPFGRTVFDCLRHSGFRYGLALADSALRVGSLAREELVDTFERMSGRFEGRQKAIDTIRLADGRAESVGESVARAVMIERGFRLP